MAIIIIDPDQITDGDEATITTAGRTIAIDPVGGTNMGAAADGIAEQALYSWGKEEWKDDPNVKSLMAHPFPFIAITPEQFEWVKNWVPANSITRKAIRTGGWKEIDSDNGDQIKAEYMGAVSLGTFLTPATDKAWYNTGDDPTNTTSTIDFDFAGPVNESILIYEENVVADGVTGATFTDGAGGSDTIVRNDAGSWITDGYRVGAQVTVLNATTGANNGTYLIEAVTASDLTIPTGSIIADTGDNTVTFARNYKNAVALYLRVRDGLANGKTYGKSALSDIGVTEVDNKVFRFPLSNASDLKITNTDGDISTLSPYTEIDVKYFATAFNREVDGATNRDFGIAVDVGTWSGVDGSFSAAGTVLTSSEGGMGVNAYQNGSIRIHEGTDENTSFTVASNTATTITISGGTFTATESAISFTAQRQTPVVATGEEIFEKIQYELRQAADIDALSSIVNGKTADEILGFTGETLEAGKGIPVNPNGGGSGVIIEGFDSNDTNRLTFYDNLGAFYTYPFVAAGSIAFNPNLVNDAGPAEYFMYYEYTVRTNVTDLALSATAGNTTSLDSAGSNLPTLAQNDYIRLVGFTGVNINNNGIYQVTDVTPTTLQADLTKIDGEPPTDVTAGVIDLDQNPIDSDDAILVKDNSGVDITGTIGAASVGFDYDYDGNVQGGRTAATVANIVIRAIGTDTAQYVETTGQITRAVGLSYSLVAALERVYSNPTP